MLLVMLCLAVGSEGSRIIWVTKWLFGIQSELRRLLGKLLYLLFIISLPQCHARPSATVVPLEKSVSVVGGGAVSVLVVRLLVVVEGR